MITGTYATQNRQSIGFMLIAVVASRRSLWVRCNMAIQLEPSKHLPEEVSQTKLDEAKCTIDERSCL